MHVLTWLWAFMKMLGVGSVIGSLLSGPIIGLIVPIIAGALSKPLADLVTWVTNLEDKLPAPVKTIVVGVTGVIFGALATLIPGFPATIGGLGNSTAIAAIISGLIAILEHKAATINTVTVVTAHNQTAIADGKPSAAAAQTLATKQAVSVEVPEPNASGSIDSGAGAMLGKR